MARRKRGPKRQPATPVSPEQLEKERFVRSLGAKPSKFIQGPLVPLPELNPDGTLKKK
jgi:hypothetical protein